MEMQAVKERVVALFKEICKMPPSAYIMKVRLESASTMLKTTVLPISEIASRTGFFDASHLTKAFVNFYGMSPISYKNQAK